VVCVGELRHAIGDGIEVFDDDTHFRSVLDLTLRLSALDDRRFLFLASGLVGVGESAPCDNVLYLSEETRRGTGIIWIPIQGCVVSPLRYATIKAGRRCIACHARGCFRGWRGG
jgi:hypothetical protein